jgi:hypothetical protein
MCGSVRNRLEEASFQGWWVSRARTPDPECGASRWLHQQKAALKFQSAKDLPGLPPAPGEGNVGAMLDNMTKMLALEDSALGEMSDNDTSD